MTHIKRTFWGGLVLLTLLWLAADPGVFGAAGVMALRGFMVQYSGVLAIGCMSAAMVLSLRPRWPERWLGGLDKMYRLHKWLGIAALVLATVHWLWAKGPKWAVGWGLMSRPERGPRPEIDNPVQAFLSGYRGIAEDLGEWAFYAVVALIVVALVRRIPYHWFYRLHRLFPVAYLVLAFHAVVLADFAYWTTPLGAVLAVLLAGGVWAAAVSLLGRIAVRRRVRGTIASLRQFPGVRAVEAIVDAGDGWPGHKPGQFAFVTADPAEGAHPFTLASAWEAEKPRIRVVAKALGDYTANLAGSLRVGQPVEIEGPYGCFTFDDGRPVQVWIGGGIGITPFIAGMKQRAAAGPARSPATVHLFHSTADVDEDALERLAEDARAAGVHLHVMIDSRDGRLSAARIRQTVPEWRDASYWFCGPIGFGRALKADLAAQGVPVAERFHQELFAMR